MSERKRPTSAVAAAAAAAGLQPHKKNKQCGDGNNDGMECCVCHEVKSDFTKAERKKANKSQEAKCRQCWQKHEKEKHRPLLKCGACGEETRDFNRGERKKAKNGQEAKCRKCLQKDQKERKRKAKIERQQQEEERKQQKEKLAKLLSQPRKCSSCGEMKPKDDFSASQQWDNVPTLQFHPEYGWAPEGLIECIQQEKAVGKCLECYPREVEEEDIANECRRKKAEECMRKLQKIRKEYEEGKRCYEYPENLWWQRQEFFKSALPDDLVGNYDIIYHNGILSSGEEVVQRTAKGKLSLSYSTDGGKLIGRVHDHGGKPSWPEPSFSFQETAKTGDRVEFQVVEHPEDFTLDDAKGSLRVLGKRVACRWIPEESVLAEHEDTDDDGLVVPRFDSAEEADSYMAQQQRVVDCSNSWMCNHLYLPEGIASLIHEYARPWRPWPPAFFFEEGDLWIQAVWDEDSRGEHCESQFIARRRANDPDEDYKK